MNFKNTCLLSLAFIFSGCGSCATSPNAGLTEYRSPGGEYVLRYLSPPWQVDSEDASGIVLEIPAPHVAEASLDAALLPAKYNLSITFTSGTARDQVELDAEIAAIDMETILVAPRAVLTDSGDAGWEMLSERTNLNPRTFRRVSFDGPGGVVIHMVFEASASLDTVEVDRMIAAFDVLEAAS
ncbi:MAG: hypothetical protein IPK60_10910 [Sandaracinaceae bacterium]|jgi:hypothetical protein|nr:hypothetical protein [Sandaracinaceae bacterium]